MAIALPGDRRDVDICATIDATIPFVDEYILYDLDDLRGRAPGDVPRLMHSRVPADVTCRIVADQRAAMQAGWQRVQPGDRLICIADEVDEAIRLIQAFAESVDEDAACAAPISMEVGAS